VKNQNTWTAPALTSVRNVSICMFNHGGNNLNFLIINSEVLRLSLSRVFLSDVICSDLSFRIVILRSNFTKVRLLSCTYKNKN